MHIRAKLFISLIFPLLCALSLGGRIASAQGGPSPEMRRVIDATVSLLSATDRSSIDAFAEAQLSPAYRASMSAQQLVEHIDKLRAAVQPHRGELNVEREPDGVRLLFGSAGKSQVRLHVGPASQWLITELSLLENRDKSVDSASAQGAHEDPREAAIKRHVKAIERTGLLGAERALEALEAGHLAAGLLQAKDRADLLADLRGLQQVIAAAGMITVEQRGEQIVLQFRGGKPADVLFAVSAAESFAITQFTIDLEPPAAPRTPAPPLAWNELDTRLRAAEREGFSGVVVAQRGGKTILSQSYGFADREQQRAATVDTVFDIGSMPIDFTRAAILWLQQEGRLSLDDTLGKYFADAPADKRGIRLAQLMDGSSGMANFHHRDGDADKDLSFIDRNTAIQRTFEQPLLFAPGEGQSHSHSAFGVLAAVVEIVSGQSYTDFLRRHLFEPAGMSRSGDYGEMFGLQAADFAVGYGQTASSPNIPPLWGPASWLVIGSGGMVSSVADMQRGYNYLASGKWLKGEALDEYQRMRIGAGGTDRGFFFLRVGGDDGDALFLASNSDKGPASNEQLLRSLIGMVLPKRADGPGL